MEDDAQSSQFRLSSIIYCSVYLNSNGNQVVLELHGADTAYMNWGSTPFLKPVFRIITNNFYRLLTSESFFCLTFTVCLEG